MKKSHELVKISKNKKQKVKKFDILVKKVTNLWKKVSKSEKK